jgi:archaellum component FlaC
MTKKEITNNEIMEALGQFAQSVDTRFDSIDKRFDSIDKHLFRIDNRLDNLESDVSDIKTKVNHIYNVLDDHMSRIETLIQEKAKYRNTSRSVWSAGFSNLPINSTSN